MSVTAKFVSITERYVELTIGGDRYRLTMYEAERLHTEVGTALEEGKELKHP